MLKIPFRLVVDFSMRIGSWTYVVGWSGRQVSDIGVRTDGGPCDCRVVRHDRPDVSAVYGGIPSSNLGFVVLIPETASPEVMNLTWKRFRFGRVHMRSVMCSAEVGSHHLRALEPILKQQIENLEPGSEDWIAHVLAIPFVVDPSEGLLGSVDLGFQKAGVGCVFSGWTACQQDAELYLVDSKKTLYPFKEIHRFERLDLAELPNISPHQLAQAGFVGFVDQDVSGPTHLLALTGESVVILAEVPEPTPLPADPKTAAKRLFSIGSPIQKFAERAIRIDWKILEPLIADQQAVWSDCVVTGGELGPQPEAPEVTLIIPLYGRQDLVEHQLMEFSRDPYMREKAEILYVVDDPQLVIPFQSELAELYQLYEQPFRWIWGSVNRGFSGANNFGVSQARSPRLLFMNSDVFPQGPGWLEQMVTALDTHPTLGIVSPRLLFANGGIQHAGMEPRRLEAIDIWINHHPNLGLDPEFDPCKVLEAVPLATGACMLTRRDEFERLGGWDSGYLIGDFEDSDLCFKYRNAGLDIGYLPTVSLVHLERQSFTQIGENSFKQRVMIANSVRHAARWPQFLHNQASLRSGFSHEQ